MRVLLALLLPLLLLAGCQTPPTSSYAHGVVGVSRPPAQVSIGKNAVGEACTQTAGSGTSADIYCGTWDQPSARVREGGPVGTRQLVNLATASPWRASLDTRFHCGSPVATTILNGNPAELMQCTQLVGGWAHVAIVAAVNGRVWYADGVLPAAKVMEHSIGVLAGVLSPGAVPVSSAADALLARRLAAQAYTAGDIGNFNALMAAGTRANLADNPGAAESAFRAALAIQQKALGKNNPNTATAMMSLALELSDEGRFVDANNLFDRAAQLAPRSSDPTAMARLFHYRGLNALNQNKLEDSLKLLTEADALYRAQVPQSALQAKPVSTVTNRFLRSPVAISSLMPNEELLTDPRAQSALLGLIEVRRYRGIVLRLLGHPKQADAMLQSASDLARGNGLARPLLTARLYRTTALTAAAQGLRQQALNELAQSTEAFSRSLPGSKPLAVTELLRARQLAQNGRDADALPLCHNAVHALADLKAGITPQLMAPCLNVFAKIADRQPDHRQQLLDEMFVAAQLAQSSITSLQIAQASATLAENARNPKVAELVRKERDLKGKLDVLYSRRDEMFQARKQGAPVTTAASASLDKQIRETRAQLADVDSALPAAAPNYGQLVQQVVSASAVFSALHPNEAFVSISLGETNGWLFLLRGHTVTVSKIAAGLKDIAGLVHRIRAGVELTTSGLPPFDIADARQLYKLTLGGVAKQLDGVKSLVVAPSGPLLSLPFEILLTGPAKQDRLAEAPWLLRRFILVHVPAASNFVSLRKIAGGSRATQPWFGFGDARPVTLAQAERSFPGASCSDSAQLLAELPVLPYAGKELTAARELLGANPADELIGPAFTAARVMKLNLKNFRILHFAAHALLPTDLRCQSQPAIVTSTPPGAVNASGALLTTSDVVRLNLDADLVILSACNTGGPGGTSAGESLSGLARAFFYAGARSLLVTHWAVNDQVAAFLVADTLRRMRDHPNLGVAGALRDAQLAMLSEAGKTLPPEIAHPFFWAPFAVIGDGGERLVTAHATVSTRRVAGL